MKNRARMASFDQPEVIAAAVGEFLLHEQGYEHSAADASVGDRVVTIVLQHPLSENERRLVELGGVDGVRQLRCEVLEAMRVELVAIVERTVGRSVAAFLAASHVSPDVDAVVFVLAEPE